MKVNLNLTEIDALLHKAFVRTSHILDQECKKAIDDPIWQWPRGESPRNIVDTRRLQESQNLDIHGMKSTISWDVPYAEAVHSGVTLRSGTVLPGRPWTEYALSKVNIPKVFCDSFHSELEDRTSQS